MTVNTTTTTNLLLNHKGPLIKICDLGFSIYAQKKSRQMIPISLTGTYNTLAPEALIDEPEKLVNGKALDVWALGCVIYTVLVGEYPFVTNPLNNTTAEILRARNAMNDQICTLRYPTRC
jgi:serine/threonine protein kinase